MKGKSMERGSLISRAVFTGVLVGFLLSVSHAEVTLDGTLGPSGPISGPDYLISDDLGQLKGSNLFHSFGIFNVNTGESATFTGPNSVENILGRVTGGSASFIDGRLSSQIPGANLFLMNPSGLMFGPNATLDLSGSFHATTADYIGLADGGRFDAATPSHSVLTAAPPEAFGFLSGNPAAITAEIRDENLGVDEGQTLSMIGGNITLNGSEKSENESLILAPSGRINLVSVASPGKVTADNPEAPGDLRLESFDALGEIQLNRVEVTTIADPGGTVYIRGGRLSLEDSTVSGSSIGDIDHPGVGADIAVTGDMTMESKEASAFVFSQAQGAGDGGDIRLRAGSLKLIDGNFSVIGTPSSGSGDAGNIEIDVGRLEMGRNSEILSRGAVSGDGGDITITAREVELSGGEGFAFIAADGGFFTPETGDSGNAGNLTITADTIRLRGGGSDFVGLVTQINSNAKGAPNAGELRLKVGRLEALDGAQISAGVTGGAGKGGIVEVTADTMLIAGKDARGAPAGIFSSAQTPFGEDGDTPPSGSGGDINITTGDLDVRDGGEISVFSNGLGNSGNLFIRADNLNISNGAFIASSNIGQGAAGDIVIEARNVRLMGPSPEGEFTSIASFGGAFATQAGDITLVAENLQVIDGATITSRTNGAGVGGKIDITADKVFIAGKDALNDRRSAIDASSSIDEEFVEQATGDGGNIQIQANEIKLQDQGLIATSSASAGAGGVIDLTTNTLELQGRGLIASESTDTGDAGSIRIKAGRIESERSSITTAATQADGGDIQLAVGQLVYLLDSEITATVKGGEGRGGNITIDPEFVILNDSNVTADAFGGPGGNIRIVADQFLASPDSAVTASSELGIDGEVVINAPATDVISGIEAVPAPFLDVSSLLSSRCAARTEATVGSFVKLGRGGVPPAPDRLRPSYYLDVIANTQSPKKGRIPAKKFGRFEPGNGSRIISENIKRTRLPLMRLADSCGGRDEY
jgi:filamentous hemagglutinin family protein